MFLGTPHRGSKHASWPATLSEIVNTVTWTKKIRADLLKNLNINADGLMALSRQSVQRLAPLKVLTCVEQNVILPLSTLVSVYVYVVRWKSVNYYSDRTIGICCSGHRERIRHSCKWQSSNDVHVFYQPTPKIPACSWCIGRDVSRCSSVGSSGTFVSSEHHNTDPS